MDVNLRGLTRTSDAGQVWEVDSVSRKGQFFEKNRETSEAFQNLWKLSGQVMYQEIMRDSRIINEKEERNREDGTLHRDEHDGAVGKKIRVTRGVSSVGPEKGKKGEKTQNTQGAL